MKEREEREEKGRKGRKRRGKGSKVYESECGGNVKRSGEMEREKKEEQKEGEVK